MGEMRHSKFRSNSPVVINGQSLSPIEVGGQRVVTLAMIDKVHGRADGTARKRFNDHRSRLVEGEDFIVRNSDEAKSLGITAPNGLTLLTETGYLMLVKSMNDDLAWQVQKQLVKAYFAKHANSSAIQMQEVGTVVAREIRLTCTFMEKLAKAAGLTGNQALISASQGTERMIGVNPLTIMGITHLDAPQNDALLSPSDIGVRTGLGSGHVINQRLLLLGYQTAHRDHKGRLYYEPTPAGEEAGGVMQDTSKKHGNGTPIRQLRWASSIIDRLKEAEDA